MRKDSSAFMVLGMHRSGTSVLAAAIESLGVNFGEHLIPPGADNPRGYWEDEEILALNERLLSALNMRWHSLSPIHPKQWDDSAVHDLERRAESLLRLRFQDCDTWGFKDPRTIRLLPFWRKVFKRLEIDFTCIVAFRNPASVASSLLQRNDFPLEKGYLLWLSHYLPYLDLVLEGRHSVVEYDGLIDNPKATFQKLAPLTGNRSDSDVRKAVELFAANIFDKGLRHTTYRRSDIDPKAPQLVLQAYDFLQRLALNSEDSSVNVLAQGRVLQHQYSDMQMPLMHLDHQLNEIDDLQDAREQNERELKRLDSMHRENAAELRRIADAIQGVHETAAVQMDELRKRLESKDQHLLKVTEQRAAALNKMLAQSAQMRKLESHVAHLDRQISDLHHSTSWKLTKPVRAAKLAAGRIASALATSAPDNFEGIDRASSGPPPQETADLGSVGGERSTPDQAGNARDDVADVAAAETATLAPSWEEWASLVQEKRPGSRRRVKLDVVIPVYRGLDETLTCIYRAVAAATTAETQHEIIVIDDGSDDIELVDSLRNLERLSLFTLIRNEENLGFVRTVNIGMRLHPDRDVVLLNSDAMVSGDWIDRLATAAYVAPRIGTVTPLSNNAEICSYPRLVRNNSVELEVDSVILDQLTTHANKSAYVDLPTAVGFCMYIRRSCIEDVGYFDAEKYGRGYGEENDFCLRAGLKGWRHLLAGDVYVKHCGGVSFGQEKDERIRNALKTLAFDFPGYGQQVQEFIAADPILPIRRNLDLARLERNRKKKSIFFVTHSWGGGIERHVQDMARLLDAEGVTVFVGRTMKDDQDTIYITSYGISDVPNAHFHLCDERDSLVSALSALGVAHIHIHSLAGYSRRAPTLIGELAGELGVEFDFTVHDYIPACPRVDLVDESGVYCGEPPVDVCERCIENNGAAIDVDSVEESRSRYERLMMRARRVFVPSDDVKVRMEKHFSSIKYDVKHHPDSFQFSRCQPVRYDGSGILRVAIIGAIGQHKGSSLILQCADDAAERNLPLQYVIIGHVNRPELSQHSRVTVTGRYREQALPELLFRNRCHLVFCSSVWPETYSFTLSAALNAGLFPVAFDFGAIAERINAINWGMVLPVDMMTKPKLVNDSLLASRPLTFTDEVRERVSRSGATYESIVRDYYDAVEIFGETEQLVEAR